MMGEPQRNRNAPIAVTGAGGFIGSNLVASLRSTGHAVRAVFGPTDPISGLMPGDTVCDVLDRDRLRDAIDGCRTVVHLAGPPSVARSFKQPAMYCQVHAAGTATLLEVANEAGLDRFVYISSAEVYGQPDQNPVAESSTLNPVSPYGAAKAAAEWTVRASAISNGHEAVILRPFTVFGPGSAKHSLMNLIIKQALTDSAIRLMNLAPVRDYVFVNDAAAAIINACDMSLEESVTVANLGRGVGISVRQLAECVLNVVGRDIEILETGQPDRPQALDIYELIADPSAAGRNLDWFSLTTLDDGIRQMLGEIQKAVSA